jgi:hypothetical protein
MESTALLLQIECSLVLIGDGRLRKTGNGRTVEMSRRANKSDQAEGICKLTGAPGRYVASHLIPAALTRLSRAGEAYVEAGIGQGTKRRFNSWYDEHLVTQEGEDILAAIDHRGIEELRTHKLVWSGWSDSEDLRPHFASTESGHPGVRLLKLPEPKALQLFFLSLVWRAAASTRQEFEAVRLPTAVVEDLRQRVVLQEARHFEDYPVQLFQLITRGVDHNRTPLLERKQIPSDGDSPGADIQYVRFYFDGLVAHVHLATGRNLSPAYLRSCVGLGANGFTIVVGHTFEQSRTWDNIQEMARTVAKESSVPPYALSVIAKAVRASLTRRRE